MSCTCLQQDFDWIAQLRYYWRQKGSITLKASPSALCSSPLEYPALCLACQETGKPSTVDKCEVERVIRLMIETLHYP